MFTVVTSEQRAQSVVANVMCCLYNVQVPKSAVVHVSPACPFFLVCAHNVHCYPGIPSLLQDLFQTNKVWVQCVLICMDGS